MLEKVAHFHDPKVSVERTKKICFLHQPSSSFVEVISLSRSIMGGCSVLTPKIVASVAK